MKRYAAVLALVCACHEEPGDSVSGMGQMEECPDDSLDGHGPGLILARVPPSAIDGVGAFRIFDCAIAHINHDDPIVYPGAFGAAHQHVYYGNENVDALTRALRGTTTCSGGTRNLSAYWMPTMLDGYGATVLPREVWIYYKGGYHSMPQASVADLPPGLRLISGPNPLTPGAARWLQCANNDGDPKTMTDCLPGDTLELRISFPQCWDGGHIDSPDHRSHVVKTVNGRCPATHPVLIPQVILAAFWDVIDPEGTLHWQLSSDLPDQLPGSSAHADYWEGWKPDVAAQFVEHCIRAGRNCNNGELGDGTRLVQVEHDEQS